jgi:hypothetical protein
MAIHVGTIREYVVECESSNENIESLLVLCNSQNYDVWCCVGARPWNRFEDSTFVKIRFFEWNENIEKDVLTALAAFEK